MKKAAPRIISALEKKIKKEIDKGKEIANDPINALLPDHAIRVTTITSDWFTQECEHCNLNFREEDHVHVCPKCEDAYHEDKRYNLNCWTNSQEKEGLCPCGEFSLTTDSKEEDKNIASDQASSTVNLESIYEHFTNGMKNKWQSFGGEEIEVLTAQSGSKAIGKSCPMCRFKIREGDRYVESPCGCKAYFHNDIFRHLTCWNNWKGRGKKAHCPISGEPCKVQFH